MPGKTDLERDKFLAENYFRLAERARQRFESRRSMEWRLALGLWAGLVSLSVALATSQWKPSGWDFGLALIVALILFAAYRTLWIPYLDQSFRYETKDSTRWENKLAELVPPADDISGDKPKQSDGLHNALQFQVCVTAVFIGIVLFIIWSRVDGS